MFIGRRSTATRLRRSLASGLLGLSALGIAFAGPAGVAAAGPAPATATITTATTCDEGHWPASVQGRPRFHDHSRAGDYIWHDRTGWHLRVTHPGSRGVVFSGTITSDTPLTVKGVRLEKRDQFTVSADKLSVSYRFVNHGWIDGIDFKTACASQLTFLSKMGGRNLPTSRIWLGHNGRHPLENPFVILRIS
jgi:hypothetical protein